MIPLLIFVASAVLLLAYEAWALLGRAPTITALVRALFRAHPWIAGSTTIGLAALWLHFLTDWP